jgi:hypothetical protein
MISFGAEIRSYSCDALKLAADGQFGGVEIDVRPG